MTTGTSPTTARQKVLRITRIFVPLSHYSILLLILITIVLLLVFTGMEITGIAQDLIRGGSTRNFLRDIAFIIVLVKAYRVLLFYFETLHVSIRYLVEIAIVAPAIEIVFAFHDKSIWTIGLLGCFSVANLVVYLKYHKRIVEIDESVLAKKVPD